MTRESRNMELIRFGVSSGNNGTAEPVPSLFPRRYAALQVEFSAAVKTSAEQKELIFKLEHDLSTIQAMSSLSRPEAEGADLSAMDRIPEPIKEATALFTGLGVSSQTELPQGQMDSLLSIISSQRERFRARNQELET
ncbi:cut-like homeobox 1b isoform X4, partial [Tachysurus ichikawai]